MLVLDLEDIWFVLALLAALSLCKVLLMSQLLTVYIRCAYM